MKIGQTNNNNASFGTFRVVVPTVTSEHETFRLLCQGIKKVYPETQIKHSESKQTIGIIKRTLYSVFNVTGKNPAAEKQLAASFATAGFQILEGIKSSAVRAMAGFKALMTPVEAVAENVRKLDQAA